MCVFPYLMIYNCFKTNILLTVELNFSVPPLTHFFSVFYRRSITSGIEIPPSLLIAGGQVIRCRLGDSGAPQMHRGLP